MPQYSRKYSTARYSTMRATQARRRSLLARAATLYASRLPVSSVGQAIVRPRRGSRAEIKMLDTNIFIPFDTAGAVGTCVPINMTAQSNLVSGRTGNSITNIDVQIHGESAGATLAAGAATQCCRLILFWDTQPNSTAVSAGTIMNTTDVSGQYNPSVKDRFKIIYDNKWAVGPEVSPGASVFNANCSPVHPITVYKKLGSIETTMNGAAGAITSCQSNALYLLTLGDQPSAPTANATLLVTVRVRFIDP